MKILVVGHFCLDVIHPRIGPRTESYGGIYYALVTLASLLAKDDTIKPVFGVNKNDYPSLIEHLREFPNIDTAGIFKFDEPTNTVELFYADRFNRKERSTGIAAPISYQKIRRHLSVDGVLINMISGFDLTLETLDHIRMAIRSHGIPLHFDFHSLTLGVDGKNGRFRRPVEEWRRWAFMDDTVQLNEEEIAGLSGQSMTEQETAGHLLTLGVKGVVVTRGPGGATLYRNDRKKVIREDVPGAEVGDITDPTGCGDVFGAAFLVHALRTRDLPGAVRSANDIAGQRLGVVGSKGLSQRLAGTKAVSATK